MMYQLQEKPTTSHPQATIAIITPEAAAAMLQRNNHNRPLKRQNIARFARAITDGNWKLQPNGIGIDINGDILDGQHRLLAIIKAGISVPMVLVTGLDPEAFKVTDTGARRSGADTLAVEDFANANLLAAVGYMIYNYFRVTKTGSVNLKSRAENYELHELALTYPKLSQVVAEAKLLYRTSEPKRFIEPRLIGYTMALYSARYPQVRDWLESILTGMGLEPNSPLTAYRNRLLADMVSGAKSHGVTHINNRQALLFRALNDTIRGKTQRTLRKLAGEAEVPQPFGITPEMVAEYLSRP